MGANRRPRVRRSAGLSSASPSAHLGSGLESEAGVPKPVKSTLPVRGRTVAMAALAAVLLGLLLAAVESAERRRPADSRPPRRCPRRRRRPAPRSADSRTAVAPQGAPSASSRRSPPPTRSPASPTSGAAATPAGTTRATTAPAASPTSCTRRGCSRPRATRPASRPTAEQGKGRWITIYANGGHAYMVIAGLRFDTSGRGEDGPRWRLEPRSDRGFAKRHPVGRPVRPIRGAYPGPPLRSGGHGR